MRKEILTKEQIELLPLVKSFSKNFGLVGGTAIALNMGHRRSIDFDLFSLEEFDTLSIRKKILKVKKIEKIFVDKLGEFTFSVNGVRMTFFHYPFKIKFSKKLDEVIKMPDLLTLAAMKAYALGHRAKWKDYVDLYFIMKSHHGMGEIVKRAKKLFGVEFNEKIFRAQLAYFKDVDYSEKIIYMKGFEVSDVEVRKDLVNFSLS